MTLITKDWKEYKILDAGDGEKLEDWNGVRLLRPDPQIIWSGMKDDVRSKDVHAHYLRSSRGGGQWKNYKSFPKSWTVRYKELRFRIKPTGFKHTGLFPEQGINWDFIMDQISGAGRPIKVLNLFAYTGGATLAAAKGGATEVVHVDASKGMVQWAKENAALSGLQDKTIRYIVDDVFKFVDRELRRGNRYDVIIMDPPSYGRGPKGEIWKLEEELGRLLDKLKRLLTPKPLLVLVNSYTTGFSHIALYNMMKQTLQGRAGDISTGELCLPIEKDDLLLPCGIYGRWVAQ